MTKTEEQKNQEWGKVLRKFMMGVETLYPEENFFLTLGFALVKDKKSLDCFVIRAGRLYSTAHQAADNGEPSLEEFDEARPKGPKKDGPATYVG